MATLLQPAPQPALLKRVNTDWHRPALTLFVFIVLAHWAEHIAQAVQIWVVGSPVKESRGVLGEPFPWLVTSEVLHAAYAVLMFAGLLLLRPGFRGRPRTWWTIALAIQIWHLFEHLLLFVQAQSDIFLLGRAVQTSVLQLFFPHVELHLFYNALVFIPMMVALVIHDWRPSLRPSAAEIHPSPA